MCYLVAMKQSDSDIIAVMEFIRNWLISVPRGELGVFAKRWGVRQDIFSKLMSAEPGERDAMFSTIYKILKGILNRPPIEIIQTNEESILATKIKRIQKSNYREVFDLMVDVLMDYEYADPVQFDAQLNEISGGFHSCP